MNKSRIYTRTKKNGTINMGWCKRIGCMMDPCILCFTIIRAVRRAEHDSRIDTIRISKNRGYTFFFKCSLVSHRNACNEMELIVQIQLLQNLSIKINRCEWSGSCVPFAPTSAIFFVVLSAFIYSLLLYFLSKRRQTDWTRVLFAHVKQFIWCAWCYRCNRKQLDCLW